MKKTILLFLLSITCYGQADFPEGINLGGNTATAETSKIVSQQPGTGELNYINATALPVSTAVQGSLDTKENVANKSDIYTVSSSTTYASTKALVDGLDTAIHTNATPETKIGGFTLGVNLANTGDSWLTFGTSVTNSAVYSTPASIQLNLTLVNYGVSGSTSNNLASQYVNIPTWTTAHRLLSVEHSINDSAQAVSLATFRSNLEAFIANAKSKGWPNNRILVINGNYCTNAPMITTLESYANEAMAIAKEQGVQYYDAYNYTLNNGDGSLLSDGVHPTTAGGLVYARGLIASMQGGMEITNGLTVDNGLQVNGIINATKQITTLGSIKTGNDATNTPANTVIGDVIVPFTSGLTTQYSQAGIIARITPLELISDEFKTSYRNYVEGGGHNFYTSGGTRGSQVLALKIKDSGLIETPFGVNSAEHISIGFNKDIKSVAAWTNKLTISEASGSTGISNGYASGDINFYTANGVTNASNLAFKVLSNKSVRTYSDLHVDGNLNLGFDKYIQYSGAYLNKITPSDALGSVVLSSGYYTGTIDFNVSDGVTNASNLALRINNNRSLSIPLPPTTSASTYDFLSRNTSTGVVEKITSTSIAPIASPTLTGTPTAPTATAGTNTTQIATTAFVNAQNAIVPLDEGNGIGYVVKGRNSANYGNIGSGATDLSYNGSTSSTVGATGIYSFTSGEQNTANQTRSGVFGGGINIASSDNAVIVGGYGNSNSGSSAGMLGGIYSQALGAQSATIGGNTIFAKSNTEVAMGSYPTDYTVTNTSTDRALVVGNGVFATPSNALVLLKNGTIIASNVIRLKNYTVATLPTGTQGDTAFVTDATAPTYLGTLTGGGAVVCPVFYNGTSWVAH